MLVGFYRIDLFYQGVVYRIAYREVENHHDAEDIAQAERMNLRKYLLEKGGMLIVDEAPSKPG